MEFAIQRWDIGGGYLTALYHSLDEAGNPSGVVGDLSSALTTLARGDPPVPFSLPRPSRVSSKHTWPGERRGRHRWHAD